MAFLQQLRLIGSKLLGCSYLWAKMLRPLNQAATWNPMAGSEGSQNLFQVPNQLLCSLSFPLLSKPGDGEFIQGKGPHPIYGIDIKK